MELKVICDKEQLFNFLNAEIKCIYTSHGNRFLDFVSVKDEIFTFQRSWKNDSVYHFVRMMKTKDKPNGTNVVPFKLIKDFYDACGKKIEDELVEHTYIDFTR